MDNACHVKSENKADIRKHSVPRRQNLSSTYIGHDMEEVVAHKDTSL